MENNYYDTLIAKSNPRLSLYEHTTSVINTFLHVYENLPLDLQRISGLKDAGIIASALHDFGKVHPEFQKLLNRSPNEWQKRRHEIISANYFSLLIISGLQDELIKDWLLQIWMAILLHHKSIHTGEEEKSSAFLNHFQLERIPFVNSKKFKIDFLYLLKNKSKICDFLEKVNEFLTTELKYPIQLNLIETIPDNFNLSNIFEKHCGIIPRFSTEIPYQENYWRYLLIKNYQKSIISFTDRYRSSILIGLIKTADHMASGGYCPINIPLLSSFPLLISRYGFQQKISEINSSLILRAPTGAGKTNAAILWAQSNQKKNGRLFYILPFQASLNAMYGRLFKFIKSQSDCENILVGISHSKNLEFLTSFLENIDSCENSGQLYALDAISLKNLTKEVYYPIKVSTAHQLLRFVLFGKGWEILLLELTNSVVIFDEIHAYEPFILGLILGMMKILRRPEINAKILVMTATIPSFIISLIRDYVFDNEQFILLELSKNEDTDNQIMTRIRHNFSFLEGTVFENLECSEFFESVKKRYFSKKSQLFICNTVKTAQKLYNSLKYEGNLFHSNDVILFHSRYNVKDRNFIEHSIISGCNESNLILIATQVVEVSLDISFDYGYFEPAPIDALVQRMGRINRQGLSDLDLEKESNVLIFKKGEHDEWIYNVALVERTLDVLKEAEYKPLSEINLNLYIEKVYPCYSNKDWNEFQRGLNHEVISNFEAKLEAGLQQEWIVELIENSDNHIDILPRECNDEFLKLCSEKNYLKAKELLLTIDIRILRGEKYRVINTNIGDTFLLDSIKFSYNNEYGLQYNDR